MNRDNVIFPDLNEKDVSVFKVYADQDDGYLYFGKTYDAETTSYVYTDKLTKDEVINLCLKGVVIDLGGEYYVPAKFAVAGSETKYAIVTVISEVTTTTEAGSTTGPAAFNFYSKEYTAS